MSTEMQLARGVPLEEALLRAGRRRFRPVVLTSITTVAALLSLRSIDRLCECLALVLAQTESSPQKEG